MDATANEIINNLKQSVLRYEPDAAQQWAEQAVAAGVDPLEAVRQMVEAIRQVGHNFGEGELFLPELVAAGAAMQRAMAVLQQEIARRGQRHESRGRVVIGTVAGDVHDIGKNMVATLTRAAGFDVIDLGVNIRAETFAEAVQKHAPDILALSALMTTTLREQKKVIDALKAAGLRDRVRVMVGGAAVTQAFAVQVGADGYEPTAPRAVELAIELMSR